jgi:hypothetical protein
MMARTRPVPQDEAFFSGRFVLVGASLLAAVGLAIAAFGAVAG